MRLLPTSAHQGKAAGYTNEDEPLLCALVPASGQLGISSRSRGALCAGELEPSGSLQAFCLQRGLLLQREGFVGWTLCLLEPLATISTQDPPNWHPRPHLKGRCCWMAWCPHEFRGWLKQLIANPNYPVPQAQHLVYSTCSSGTPSHTMPTPLPREQFITCHSGSYGDKLTFHSSVRINQERHQKAAAFTYIMPSTSLMLWSLEREHSASEISWLFTKEQDRGQHHHGAKVKDCVAPRPFLSFFPGLE